MSCEITKLICENTKLICENTKLICEITKLICENTKLICENTKLICEITKLICENTKLIYNGNCTEWRAIWSEIKRVITKSHDRVAGVRFVITSLISDQNCPTRSAIPLYYIHFEILNISISKPEIVSSFTKTHTLPWYSPERRSVATTQMCSDQCCANVFI